MKILKVLPLILLFTMFGLHQNQMNAQAGCDPDVLGPTVVCFASIEKFPASNQDIIVVATEHVAGVNDNCTDDDDMQYFISLDLTLTEPPSTQTLTLPAGTDGSFPIMVWAVDTSGNYNVCWGSLEIEQNTGACDPDNTAPVINCNDFINVAGQPGDDILINPDMVLEGIPFDSCTTFSNLEFLLTTDLSLTSPPANGELIFPAGTNDTVDIAVWAVDEAGNFTNCFATLSIQSIEVVNGTVYIDDNQDCNFDSMTENALGGFTIQYSSDQGATFQTVETDINGEYSILLWGAQNSDEVLIELLLPNGVSSNCPTTSTIIVNSGAPDQNFSVNLATDCELMVTDISTLRLRRCFGTNYYVNYCNLSTFDIDDVELVVNLTDEMTVNGSSMPSTDLGNGDLLFELGTVSSGFCGQILINISLDCVVPLGAIVCVESTISPYGCADSLSWNGSNLIVSGECDEQNNQVQFEITNIGTAPMPSPENFIVVEDVVMYMNTPIQLGINESEMITVPSNGSTWRVEIPQEAGHPSLSSYAAKVIEGCGGYGTMGILNLFPTPDDDPFLSIDCQEVIGSFDPNDKQAVPIGVSDEHFIEQNTSLEYKIRFQNTGTDTAFTVRIEDRISSDLDFASIQAGASSHPYRVEIGENGLLIFHFENIMLPDSNINEAASHGFVQFRINQLPDNAIGTVIENTADIYFDFNEAIVTNTVIHTIGSNFVTTNTNKILVPNLEITAVPNPFTTQTLFTLKGVEIQDVEFELYDVTGRLVKRDNFSGNQYQLNRNGIPTGTYLFRFVDKQGILANGKIVIQ